MLSLWLEALGDISADDDPCDAISKYIRRKLDLSRHYPEASRLFAIEIIGGAPVIGEHLQGRLRDWVAQKGAIFHAWQQEGRMAPIDPAHACFMIWAATQTYADFQVQIEAVISPADYDTEVYEKGAPGVAAALVRGLGLSSKKRPLR